MCVKFHAQALILDVSQKRIDAVNVVRVES